MKRQLVDISGVQKWSLSDEVQKSPSDKFLLCRCNSLNPLGILSAPNDRIQAAITEAKTYPDNRVNPVEFINSIRNDYEVKYIKSLDNEHNRLMCFCFSPILLTSV